MPTNKTSISVIVTTIAIMAFLCVCTICYLSYKGIQIPPELNTLTAGLSGALSGMLVKTTPTETTKSVSVENQPTVVDATDPTKPKT